MISNPRNTLNWLGDNLLTAKNRGENELQTIIEELTSIAKQEIEKDKTFKNIGKTNE